MHLLGKGTPKDARLAVAWFRAAASQGHAIAQLNLGIAYLKGTGAPADMHEYVAWLKRAALQGEAEASLLPGAVLAEAGSPIHDDVEAYAWFTVAVAQGEGVAAAAAWTSRTALEVRMGARPGVGSHAEGFADYQRFLAVTGPPGLMQPGCSVGSALAIQFVTKRING